jgi:hypothetical protein
VLGSLRVRSGAEELRRMHPEGFDGRTPTSVLFGDAREHLANIGRSTASVFKEIQGGFLLDAR